VDPPESGQIAPISVKESVLIKSRPSLEQTLACYLHQDWTLDFGSEETALDTILTECSDADISAAAKEIDELLASSSEAELREALTDAGCHFCPPGAGLTYRDWLAHVRVKLKAHDR